MKQENNKNSGVTLIELIIVIAIMAVLMGLLIPQFFGYLNKAKKATDVASAKKLSEIINAGLVDYPEANKALQNYKNNSVKRRVSVTVGGVTQSYDVYLLMVNEDKYKYWFYGTMNELLWKSDSNIGFYNYINRELGFEGIMKGTRADWTRVRMNEAMIPEYKVDPPASLGSGAVIDRWRIVKRVDNGSLEVWSSADFHDGRSGGGKPCYRVWPNPDDVYAQ